MGETESPYRHRLRSLKSGRVARVALAYAAGGWLLVQVASTMLVPLGLPAWALRFIIVLVIAGFFIAIAVAWGFGTKEGAGSAAPEHRDAEASRPSGSHRRTPWRCLRCRPRRTRRSQCSRSRT